jgi:hypothetical protein
MTVPRRRSRILFLLLAVATIVLGLATRRVPGVFPGFVARYAGDVLWAAMVYLLMAAAWPAASTRRIAAAAMIVSLAVEVGQLYHAPWIDGVRQTRVGGLVLGRGFLWSDLACYAVGIALAAALHRALAPRSAPGPRFPPPADERAKEGCKPPRPDLSRPRFCRASATRSSTVLYAPSGE